MAWKETRVLDQRMELVTRYLLGGEPLRALCRRYDVSEKTGHKWVRRYRELGPQGLHDWNRSPLRHPNATPAEVVSLLLQAKLQRLHWGPRKLVAWLSPRYPETALPAVSTVGEILKRHGLVSPRKRVRHTDPWSRPFSACNAPNDTWSADFKGWFRTGDPDMSGRPPHRHRRPQPLRDRVLGAHKHALRGRPSEVRAHLRGVRVAGDDPH